MKKLLLLSMSLALFSCEVAPAFATTSTVNPNVPATGSALSSATLRANFLAAYNDINTIYGQIATIVTNGITSLSGDVTTTTPVSGVAPSSIAKIQGTTVAGTTGTNNVVFSASPTLSGTLTAGSANFSGAISGQNFASTGTGADTVPVGTTGQQPTPAEGMLRDNITLHMLETYLNGGWQQIVSATNGLVNMASQVTGVLPSINGGSGQNWKTKHDLFANASIFPNIYPNSPTVSWTGPGGSSPITNAVSTGYQGQQFAFAVNTTVSSGNVLTFASGLNVGTYIQIGMPVTHLVSSSETNAIPSNSVVTAVTSTTVTFSGSGLTGTVTSGDQIGFGLSVVNFMGSVPTIISQFGQNYWGNGGNAQWTREPYSIEFEYYGTKFDVIYRDMAGNPNFWVWVDGQPVTSTAVPTSGVTNSAGSGFRIVVNFNNANDNTARWRRIRLYFALADFGGIEFSPTDTISHVRAVVPKMAFLGDSWCEGVTGTAFGLNSLTTFPQEEASLLGFGTPLIACQGGTGYVSNPGGGKEVYGAADRLAAIVAYNPDVLHIEGSVNDNGSSPSVIQAAATAVFSYLKTNLPNTKIFVTGVQSRGGFSGTSDYANNAAVSAAAAAAGLTFIDPLDHGWIQGSGKYGATTGIGNADLFVGSDGVHLQQPGWEYYGRRNAAEIANGY